MVTAGELVLTVAGVATTLGPGDFISFSADRAHAYDVVGGAARGVMTMVYPEVPAPVFTAGSDLPPATSGRAAG